jgi:hypothetical protein
MFVDETYVYGSPFDSEHSPKTQGIQQRTFVVHMANSLLTSPGRQ